MANDNIGKKLLKDCNVKPICLGGIGKATHQDLLLKSFR